MKWGNATHASLEACGTCDKPSCQKVLSKITFSYYVFGYIYGVKRFGLINMFPREQQKEKFRKLFKTLRGGGGLISYFSYLKSGLRSLSMDFC